MRTNLYVLVGDEMREESQTFRANRLVRAGWGCSIMLLLLLPVPRRANTRLADVNRAAFTRVLRYTPTLTDRFGQVKDLTVTLHDANPCTICLIHGGVEWPTRSGSR